MIFTSTRNPFARASLHDVALSAFPADGGLYIPVSDPVLQELAYHLSGSESFREIATCASAALLGDVLNPVEAGRVAERAFTFAPGVEILDGQVTLIDLSTGPSRGFKDYGMAFLASVIDSILEARNANATVLLATTGDTGAAAAHAFRDSPRVRTVLLYPGAECRGVDPGLMEANGGRVLVLGVRGNLDDCRRIVRQAFADPEAANSHALVPATSANVVRLIPQVICCLYAFLSLKRVSPGDIRYVVPAGNFGSLLSGLYAWKWGVPASGFAFAGAADGIFPDSGGKDELPADDPENRDRIKALAAGAPGVLRSMIDFLPCGEVDRAGAIAFAYGRTGRLLDPETAVAYRAVAAHAGAGASDDSNFALFGVSHPSRHADEVERACGVRPEVPRALAAALEPRPVAHLIEPEVGELLRAIGNGP